MNYLFLILPNVFIALAAYCKAVADTLTHHIDTSVFKWRDKRFWNPEISATQIGFIRFTKYRPDAWHLFNSGMICSLIAAVVFHHHLGKWYWQFAEYIEMGAVYNLTFNLFYNRILRRK